MEIKKGELREFFIKNYSNSQEARNCDSQLFTAWDNKEITLDELFSGLIKSNGISKKLKRQGINVDSEGLTANRLEFIRYIHSLGHTQTTCKLSCGSCYAKRCYLVDIKEREERANEKGVVKYSNRYYV